MSWKLRHQGSPRHVGNLTFEQVIEGIRDAAWEPTDEVLGPGDHDWRPIENHPLLADAALEAEDARNPPKRDEETQVDMVPLIDVCMVLLVFFILATTCQALERVLNLPPPGGEGVIAEESLLIRVVVGKTSAGQTFIAIEDQPLADAERLEQALRMYLKPGKTNKLVIRDRDADWGDVVRVIDAAGAVGIRKVFFELSSPAAPAPGRKS